MNIPTLANSWNKPKKNNFRVLALSACVFLLQTLLPVDAKKWDTAQTQTLERYATATHIRLKTAPSAHRPLSCPWERDVARGWSHDGTWMNEWQDSRLQSDPLWWLIWTLTDHLEMKECGSLCLGAGTYERVDVIIIKTNFSLWTREISKQWVGMIFEQSLFCSPMLH